MAPDDRDRTFEKALARHLRSAASSGTDANTPVERQSNAPSIL